jgi:hypothetical protein
MIFDFDSDGFLTDRRRELEAGIERSHRDLFSRARQINHDCHELLFAADIRNRDARHLLVAPLFGRALEHYQAALILLGMGLIAPARVLLRAIVEATFTTRAVALHEEALKAFINADLVWRRKMIKKAQRCDHTNLEDLRQAITPALVEKLEEQIKSSGTKQLTAEDLSKFADMHEWYTTHYALLSKATHTNVQDLESYLSVDDAGEVRGFIYAPSMEEIPLLVLTAAHCILLGAAAFAGTFELDFQAKGSEHIKFVETAFRSLNEQ